MSVVFCWWVVCVTLMETWIAWRSLHHMRLAIHHVAHCFWIRGRWSCVWSKNCLTKKNKIRRISLSSRNATKPRRLERIADNFAFFFLWRNKSHFYIYINIAIHFRETERMKSFNMKYSYLLCHLDKIHFLSNA